MQQRRRIKIVSIAAVAVFAFVSCGSAAQAADHYRRSFNWSGYRWSVRFTEHRADPGGNRWGDSKRNVRVRGDRSLLVAIADDRSVEVVGPPTGYGRYRWVVRTDLSTVDPFRVVGFFVHGTRGEQDIEFSRWGVPALVTPGSWVTWRRSTRLGFGEFTVSPAAPYTIEIDWLVGATRFRVHDATGASLLDTTSPTHSGGRHIAPRISYWRFPGTATSRPAFTTTTVHPPVIVQSFHYVRAR